MSRSISLAVVLLVVVAGCSALPQSNGPSSPQTPGTGTPLSPDATTAPGTSSADPMGTATSSRTPSSPTPSGESLAPGVTDRGLRNASRLVDAHTAALRERGFELAVERRRTTDALERNVTYRLRSTPELQRFGQTAATTTAGSRTVHRSWLNATMDRMLIRIDTGESVSYRIPPVGPAGAEGRTFRLRYLVHADQLASLLDGGEFEVTGVEGTGSDRRVALAGSDFAADGYYADREVRLTVDADGVIHSLNATGTLSGGDAFRFRYRVDRVGVGTVERPAWVATAPAPIDTRPSVGYQNCTAPYLTIENPGPATVPAGTTVTVRLSGTDHRASLDDPLPQDGERALYLDASGSLRITDVDAVPDDRTGMPDEAAFTVATGENMLLSQGGISFGCATGDDGSDTGGSSSGRIAEPVTSGIRG